MDHALLVSDQHLDERLLVSKPSRVNAGSQTQMHGIFGQPVHFLSQAKSIDRTQGQGINQFLSESHGSQLVWTNGSRAKDMAFETYFRRAKDGLEAIEKRGTRAMRSRSFQQEVQWLAENRNRFLGRWVALQGNVLLAEGATAREVFQQVAGQELPPLVIRIDSEDLPFAGW